MHLLENERRRLEKLYEYRILDTPAEQSYDDIVFMAAQLCAAPIALISFVDTERIWFKARIGVAISESQRAGSFYALAIEHDDVTVVPDTLHDPRFNAHPLVTAAPYLRFYAGMPIRAATGEILGALCVLDQLPKQLTPAQVESIRALTRQVELYLKLRLEKQDANHLIAYANQTVQKLRHALDLQSSLLNSAPIMIIATDLNGTITLFNPAAERMLQYKAAEMIGICTPSVIHDEVEIIERAAQLSLESGRNYEPGFQVLIADVRPGAATEREWTCIRKNGNRFIAKITLSCIIGADGNISGYLGVAIDISKHKQAEMRLVNSELFTRTTLDTLSKQFCILDQNGTILAINKPWLNFELAQGNSINSLSTGQNYLALLEANQRYKRGVDSYLEKIQQAIAGMEDSISFEYSVLINNEAQWFNGKIFPFPKPQFGKVILTHENITEYKRLQHRFEQAIESAPNAIVMVNKDGTILMVNRQAELSFGYARAELLGKPMELLLPQRFRSSHAKFRQHFITKPPAQPTGAGKELYAVRKNGSEFPVEIGLGLIEDEPEHGIIILSSIIDISERKKTNDILKHALNEKEVLLKEVYHRVKNNLQVISSLINLQARNVEDNLAKQLLKQSSDRINSMAVLHEKLYQSKDLANIDVKSYVQELVDNLKISYGVNTKKIKINLKIEDLKLNVDTAIPCGLIINELVSNSLKHAFPDNKSGKITILLTSHHDRLTLAVTDNGIGFAPEQDVKKSSSLGLKLVNILASQLSGNCVQLSQGGSSFSLSFPMIFNNLTE